MGLFSRKKKINAKAVTPAEIKANESLVKLRQEIDHLTNQYREANKSGTDIDRQIDDFIGWSYTTKTVSDWRQAMQSADVPWGNNFHPNWVRLFDIYRNMAQDSHVSACIDTLVDGCVSQDFYIADKEGERIDDLTEMFKKKWFSDFCEAIVNAKLCGFGLIQIDAVDTLNGDMSVREINRKHIRPDLDGIVKHEYDNEVYNSWTDEPYRTFTIFTFDETLGKLNTAVRWWIYKTEVSRMWAKYNQIFSIPPIIVKTQVTDRERKENAVEMVKKWLSSRFMVIDEKDTIEPFSSGSSTGQANPELFEKMIRLADEQISKALLLSTMVLDNGSSRSQAEVHEENTGRAVKSNWRLIESQVNGELLPRMRKIGFGVPEGAKIMLRKSDKMTKKDNAEIVTMLSNNYKISPDTVTDTTGVEVEEKEIKEDGNNGRFDS